MGKLFYHFPSRILEFLKGQKKCFWGKLYLQRRTKYFPSFSPHANVHKRIVHVKSVEFFVHLSFESSHQKLFSEAFMERMQIWQGKNIIATLLLKSLCLINFHKFLIKSQSLMNFKASFCSVLE